LLLCNAVGREAEVAGQLSDLAEVSVMGALFESGDLQILTHLFPQRIGGPLPL
jgi:hypothetical protein